MKIYGFIPARMASTRLPGKPLKMIQGRTMLEHVYERSNFYKKCRWGRLAPVFYCLAQRRSMARFARDFSGYK